MNTSQAKLLINSRCAHGEGPCWDAASQRLLWVDMVGCKIHSLDPATGDFVSHSFEEPVCVVVPEGNGRHLVAFAKHLDSVDLASGNIREIVQVEPDMPGNRCNDGKMDPAGRFWIGTMSSGEIVQGAGSLYRLDGEKNLVRVLDNLTISNGMDWTSDGRTMYFIDSPTREVWAFDFNMEDSSISNQRTVVRVPEELGIPDGMCIAPDGTIWVAHWGAGCVCRWDTSTGCLLQRIDTGCPHTTSCCLAPDGSLFITTSRQGLKGSELRAAPHSGSLFVH
jgi:sugar lactone lactonase YvrE